MPEFSSFNGYTVKDTTARNIAKGRNQAVAFGDYASMIVALNAMEKGEYKTGQNIYIGTVGVPDLWVYSVEDILHVFVHESDEDVVEKLTANTTIQVGYYKLAMLEGQKVDLTTVNAQLAEHTAGINNLNGNVNALNGGGAISGMSVEEDGAYITYTLDGETVKKKLGSVPMNFTIQSATTYNTHANMTNTSDIQNLDDYSQITVSMNTKANGNNNSAKTVVSGSADGSGYVTLGTVKAGSEGTYDISAYKCVKIAVTSAHSGNVSHSATATYTATVAIK